MKTQKFVCVFLPVWCVCVMWRLLKLGKVRVCVEAASIHLHHAPLNGHKEEGNEAGTSSIQLAPIYQAGQMVVISAAVLDGSPEKIDEIKGAQGGRAGLFCSPTRVNHFSSFSGSIRTPISPAPTGCYWKCNSMLQSFVRRLFLPHQHVELRLDRCAVLFSDNSQQRSSRR